MILSHLDSFSYRMIEHSLYSSQVTFSSRNGLIIYMYFINLHYKYIVMIFKIHHISMTHLNITLKDQVYHHFIFLSFDGGFIKLSNWVDNIHKSNDLSYHFIIKIAFTFWRTIWRPRSVLPFIIITMMTIIIPSFHSPFNIVKYLSSYRLTIYCYHIHTIE